MQGKQQRSSTVPDYKALAGKVTRAPRGDRHEREVPGRSHAKDREPRVKEGRESREHRESREIREQAPAPEVKEREAPAAVEVLDESAFGDASNTTNNIGGAYKSAALHILQAERRLMSVGEIVKLALEHKLIKSTGRTPEVTMSSALHAEVRKRGLLSVFFRPKAGLFGLKAWLSEIWLQEWLIKEGLNPEDFAPELMEIPPNKRQRVMNSRPAHRSDPNRSSEQQRSEAHRHEHRAEPPARAERAEVAQREPEHRVPVTVGSRSGTSQTEMETDSDERTSNLNLLLEAADELDREDDRGAEQQQPQQPRQSLTRRHSLATTSSPTLSASGDTQPQTSERPKHTKTPSPTPTEVEQVVQLRDPAPLPQFNPVTSPHRYLPKGALPPLPPTLPHPQFPFSMSYPLPGATLINPLLAQQIFAAHHTHPHAHPVAAHMPHSVDRLTGVVPLGMPFPATHHTLTDALPAVGSVTPSVSPSTTPISTPLGTPHPTPPATPLTSPSAKPGLSLDLELTGRSIVSILQAAKLREAETEKENGPVKRQPVNILNLPLPSFDTEDYDSEEAAAAAKQDAEYGVTPEDDIQLPASHSLVVDLTATGSITPSALDQDADVVLELGTGGRDAPRLAAAATAAAAAPAGAADADASAAVAADGRSAPVLPSDQEMRAAAAPAPASASNHNTADGGPQDMEDDTAAKPEPATQPQAQADADTAEAKPPVPAPAHTAVSPAPAPTAAAPAAAAAGPSRVEQLTLARAPSLGAKKEAAAARLALKELKRAAQEAAANGATSGLTGKALEHEKINMFRQHIQILETNLGSMHPQVGKAYVFLARALQHEGSRWSLTMAQRALLRSWQILASVKTRVNQEQPASLNDFSYLMGHLQETQMTQAVQLQHHLQVASAQAQQVMSHAKMAQMFMLPPPGVAPQAAALAAAGIIRPQ